MGRDSAADAALQARAAAARELIGAGELSPWSGLFLTCFPPDDVEQASLAARSCGSHDRFTDVDRAHAVELVHEGMSHRQAAHEIGASRAAVSEWVRAAGAISTAAV